MARAEFTMNWISTGKQSIILPDRIDASDAVAVRNYILENWGEIPIPTDSEYLMGSDVLDEESGIEIIE